MILSAAPSNGSTPQSPLQGSSSVRTRWKVKTRSWIAVGSTAVTSTFTIQPFRFTRQVQHTRQPYYGIPTNWSLHTNSRGRGITCTSPRSQLCPAYFKPQQSRSQNIGRSMALWSCNRRRHGTLPRLRFSWEAFGSIDGIYISHAHCDHPDLHTLTRIWKMDFPRVDHSWKFEPSDSTVRSVSQLAWKFGSYRSHTTHFAVSNCLVSQCGSILFQWRWCHDPRDYQ